MVLIKCLRRCCTRTHGAFVASLSQRTQLELLRPPSVSGAQNSRLREFPVFFFGSFLFPQDFSVIVNSSSVYRHTRGFPQTPKNCLYSKYFYIFLKYSTKFINICSYGKKSKQTCYFHNKSSTSLLPPPPPVHPGGSWAADARSER